MAQDEIVKILKVQTAGSETTVKQLREEIKGLQDALLNMEAGTKEYDDTVKQLVDDQAKLAGVMNAGKESGAALEGSYNALQQRLTALTKVWKATNDEATRKKLGNEMKEIRGELSKLDESTGDFRRNVGNYAGSIKDAFSSMGGAVSKVTSGPLQAFKSALGAISKHPIIATVSLLAGLLVNGLAKAFKRNNDAMDGLQRAFTVFQPIIKATEKAFDAFAGAISKVVEGLSSVVSWIGQIIPGYKEMQEAALAAAKLQEDIDERERNGIVQNAAARKRASEARAKSEDKIKYTAKERMAFLNQAIQEEESILEREKVIAAEKLLIAQQEYNANTGNTEALVALNEAAANYIDAQAAFTDAQRENNRKRSRLYKEAQSDATAALLARLNLEKDILDQEMGLVQEGSEKQVELAKEKRKKELEIQKRELRDKFKNQKEYNEAVKLAEKKYQQDLLNIEMQASDARVRSIDVATRLSTIRLRENTPEYFQKVIEGEVGKLKEMKNSYDTLLAKYGMDEDVQEGFANKRLEIAEQEQKILSLIKQEVLASKELINAQRDFDLYNYEPELVKVKKQLENVWDDIANLTDLDDQIAKKLEKYGIEAITGPELEEADEFITHARALYTQAYELNKRFNELWDHYAHEQALVVKDAMDLESFITESHSDWYKFWYSPNNRNVLSDLQRELDSVSSKLWDFQNDQKDNFRQLYNDHEEDIRKRIENYVRIMSGITDTDQLKVEVDKTLKELFGSTTDLFINFDRRIGEAYQNGTLANFFDKLATVGLIPENVFTDYLALLQNYVNAEKSILDQRYENWQSINTGVADLAGSIGDIYENILEKQVKEGELSEKEAEKQYEHIKAIRKAEAIINTISGALGAFMGITKDTGGWGIAIAAVQAAAIMAAGYAQVQQIDATSPYSNTNLDQSAQYPSVTPYVPQYTQNVTGLQETEQLANALSRQNIWVSVKDIESAQKQSQVKVAETRF